MLNTTSFIAVKATRPDRVGRENFAAIADGAIAPPWVPRNPRPIAGPEAVREILELAA